MSPSIPHEESLKQDPYPCYEAGSERRGRIVKVCQACCSCTERHAYVNTI